ncbi:hypothetical protein V2J09_007445, partial [Rumex salicifolius]
TILTASAHIITAVIGSGVLSLAWATVQLGWIAGPLILLLFSWITYISAMMLADCYRNPDPVTGKRNYTYSEVVESYLGGINVYLCRVTQYANCAGVAVGYTIIASLSMVAVGRSNCYHKYGHEAKCDMSNYPFMMGFRDNRGGAVANPKLSQALMVVDGGRRHVLLLRINWFLPLACQSHFK